MEDNKEKQTPGLENQNSDTQTGGQPNPTDFGATGMDDINKNLGQFTNTVVQPEAPTTPELKLDVDSKVVEKASKEEINFERFSKTKKERKHVEKAPKTRFGEKVSMMLRSKKGLITTWVLELVIMILIIVAGAILIAWLTPFTKRTSGPIYVDCLGMTKAGIVFLWISLFPCVIPLVYLITTWFIGINQVASSKTYHIFFWITLAVSLVCFILGIGLCAKAMYYINNSGFYSVINVIKSVL